VGGRGGNSKATAQQVTQQASLPLCSLVRLSRRKASWSRGLSSPTAPRAPTYECRIVARSLFGMFRRIAVSSDADPQPPGKRFTDFSQGRTRRALDLLYTSWARPVAGRGSGLDRTKAASECDASVRRVSGGQRRIAGRRE